MDWQEIWNNILNWLSTSGLRFLIGLVGMLILFKIVNLTSKRLKRRMEKKNVEKTIVSVTFSAYRKVLKLVIFICFIGYIGFDTSSISALIASLGVGIGLAMQGALSNLAGGILIIILRPFRIDDFIEAQGVLGSVEEIGIFYTHLVTPDNKAIMVPNGALLNGNITNYSKKEIRRVDLKFSISYEEDFERAIDAIKKVCAKCDMILPSPDPFVRVSAHNDSSVEITVRVWANNGDYWSVYFFMEEEVKKSFDANGIVIPYPQLDVHVDKTISK